MELSSLNLTPREPSPATGRVADWKKYKEETGRDFILDEADRVMNRAGDDPEIKQGAYQYIVGLILEYPKPYQHDFYIKALGRRFKPVKHWKDEYATQCKEREETAEMQQAPSDDADTSTLETYGFYTEDNKYWFATNQGFQEGTNFVLEPLFHIYSSTNNRRLIRVTNEYNISILCDIPSDAMVSVEKFQSFLYSEGNYLIFINNNLFKKLLRYVGNKFPKCFEIKTFGWQPEGFWAYADGIYNGHWQPVNNMGITAHAGKNYFSPAFSEVYNQLRVDDDVYENDRRFVYRPSNVTITEWSRLIQRVYATNHNGQYGIAFLCASVYRSTIYNLYKIFPHLFLHGEKGSGKSQLGWSLSNVFLYGSPPFNLSAGTDVAFFRSLSFGRDVVKWFDEYTDAIEEKRFQALKSAFDGVGREKGKMSKDSRTESDKINSACVISGQYLPQRDDNSLYTRSIIRFFVKPKNGYSREEIDDFEQLKRIEEEGLSQIVTTLLDHRETVEKKFARTFSDMLEYYKEQLIIRSIQLDDRILRNYTYMASIVWIFQKETTVELSINPEIFREMCLQDAIEQSDKVTSSDALGTFWKILSGLIQEKQLTESDYDLKEKLDETRISRSDGERKLIEINFNSPTRIIYIDFNQVHIKYMDQHRKIFGVTGLNGQTMMDYTHNHWSYLGLKGSHYFSGGNGKRTSAHMFNYDLLVERGSMPELFKAFRTEEIDTEEINPDNRITSSQSDKQTGIPF